MKTLSPTQLHKAKIEPGFVGKIINIDFMALNTKKRLKEDQYFDAGGQKVLLAKKGQVEKGLYFIFEDRAISLDALLAAGDSSHLKLGKLKLSFSKMSTSDVKLLLGKTLYCSAKYIKRIPLKNRAQHTIYEFEELILN